MKLGGWLNWTLFAVMVLLIGVNATIFLRPRWLASLTTVSSQGKNLPACLKTSDFYAAHLTTYFLPATADGALDPKRKARRYEEYCDHIPGPGQVAFTVDLMDLDTRNISVALSLSRINSGGRLDLVKDLPPTLYPGGVLTLNVPMVERGQYVLKLAFGEAKAKDDIIEMPISVGQ